MLYIAFVFIALNFSSVLFFDLGFFRSVRLTTTISALLYLYSAIKCDQKWIYFVFWTLIASDISLLFYESLLGPWFYLGSSIVAYLVLSAIVFNKIEWKRIAWLDYTIYMVMFFFNMYILYYTLNDINAIFESKWLYNLIFTTGALGVVMCLLSAFVNVTRPTVPTEYFMYVTFGLVISNFVALLAYYYDLFTQILYFIERGAYLFGLFFLVRYAYILQMDGRSTTKEAIRSSQDSVSH